MTKATAPNTEGPAVFVLKVVRPDGVEENLSDLTGVTRKRAYELQDEEIRHIQHEGRAAIQGGYVLYIADSATRLQEGHVRCCFDPAAAELREADILYMDVTLEGVFMIGQTEDGDYFTTLQKPKGRNLSDQMDPNYGMTAPLKEIKPADIIRTVAQRNSGGLLRAVDLLTVTHRGRSKREDWLPSLLADLTHTEAVSMSAELLGITSP